MIISSPVNVWIDLYIRFSHPAADYRKAASVIPENMAFKYNNLIHFSLASQKMVLWVLPYQANSRRVQKPLNNHG